MRKGRKYTKSYKKLNLTMSSPIPDVVWFWALVAFNKKDSCDKCCKCFFFSVSTFLWFFLNGPTSASFSFNFDLFFKQPLQIFTTNICEKMSSIQCRDSNPQPSVRESPPTTTRPGQHFCDYIWFYKYKNKLIYLLCLPMASFAWRNVANSNGLI